MLCAMVTISKNRKAKNVIFYTLISNILNNVTAKFQSFLTSSFKIIKEGSRLFERPSYMLFELFLAKNKTDLRCRR